MPVFLIERRFAQDLEVSPEAGEALRLVNDDEGVRWLYSFLSKDRRKTFCLYEAPDVESVLRAARRADLPADAVVEVTDMIRPEGRLTPIDG